MALFDSFIDFTPIYQKITEARNLLTIQIAELKGELMATVAEVKMSLVRLTTEVSESVEAISALRADSWRSKTRSAMPRRCKRRLMRLTRLSADYPINSMRRSRSRSWSQRRKANNK